jgi:hypothetical protein
MKPINFIARLFLVCSVVACAGADSATGSSNTSITLEKLTKGTSSKTSHDEGWTIVSAVEAGDRVYWFFAPEVNNVSPAMFKMTVFNRASSKQGFEVVSECEAPKQVCDGLMKQFKTLSEKYKRAESK